MQSVSGLPAAFVLVLVAAIVGPAGAQGSAAAFGPHVDYEASGSQPRDAVVGDFDEPAPGRSSRWWPGP